MTQQIDAYRPKIPGPWFWRLLDTGQDGTDA